MQRHKNDTVERLWPGAADPGDPKFVPVELRDLVATIPADIESKLRWGLHTTKEMIRTIGRRTDVINPSADPDDLETGLVWKKCDWARNRLHGDRAAADQAAYDAATYRCSCCGEVHVPGMASRTGTSARTFADGTRAKVCGRCAVVLERLAVERVAAEMVNGTTRLELAADVLAKASP